MRLQLLLRPRGSPAFIKVSYLRWYVQINPIIGGIGWMLMRPAGLLCFIERRYIYLLPFLHKNSARQPKCYADTTTDYHFRHGHWDRVFVSTIPGTVETHPSRLSSLNSD